MNWSEPSVVLTAVIALSTVVYVILTALIWWATLQNTRATREILESSHRPYLGIANVALLHEHLQHTALTIVVQNVGSVPSRCVEVDVNVALAGKVSRAFDGSAQPPLVLMPGQSFSLTHDLTEEEIKYLERSKEFEARVEIRYCGGTDKQYRTSQAYACNGIEEFVMVSGEMH
jgi:hypothetical protein